MGESETYKKESDNYRKDAATKTGRLEAEVKDLKDACATLQRNNSTLKREKDELEGQVKARSTNSAFGAKTSSQPISFESAKASETAAELLKAKEKISELESWNSKLETEKKGMKL